MTEQTNETEFLKRHLRQLYAFACGFVFTEDEATAKAMPTSQRYAAIAGLLSRLATEGVLDELTALSQRAEGAPE